MLATLPLPRLRACIHIILLLFFISFNRSPVIYLFAPLFCSDNEKSADKKYVRFRLPRRLPAIGVWAHSSFGSLKVKLKTSRIYSSAKRFFPPCGRPHLVIPHGEHARTRRLYKCVKLHFQNYACVYKRFVIIV